MSRESLLTRRIRERRGLKKSVGSVKRKFDREPKAASRWTAPDGRVFALTDRATRYVKDPCHYSSWLSTPVSEVLAQVVSEMVEIGEAWEIK